MDGYFVTLFFAFFAILPVCLQSTLDAVLNGKQELERDHVLGYTGQVGTSQQNWHQEYDHDYHQKQ